MDRIAAGRPYAFQEDSALRHNAKTTKARLLNNILRHWLPALWPPSSPECNPIDYFYCCWLIEAKTNKPAHNTVNFMKGAIVAESAPIDKNMVTRACNSFRSHLESVVGTDDDCKEK